MEICKCGVSKCEYWFCRDRGICLIGFNSLTADERSRINGFSKSELNHIFNPNNNLPPRIKVKKKPKEKKPKEKTESKYFHPLLEKTDGKCWLCGIEIKNSHEFSKDHVIPKSKGGYGADNFMPAHKLCNSLKSNRYIESKEEFIDTLKLLSKKSKSNAVRRVLNNIDKISF